MTYIDKKKKDALFASGEPQIGGIRPGPDTGHRPAGAGNDREPPYPPFRRRPIKWARWHLFNNWANTYKLGKYWEVEVEWVPKARYWTLCLQDRRVP